MAYRIRICTLFFHPTVQTTSYSHRRWLYLPVCHGPAVHATSASFLHCTPVGSPFHVSSTRRAPIIKKSTTLPLDFAAGFSTSSAKQEAASQALQYLTSSIYSEMISQEIRTVVMPRDVEIFQCLYVTRMSPTVCSDKMSCLSSGAPGPGGVVFFASRYNTRDEKTVGA